MISISYTLAEDRPRPTPPEADAASGAEPAFDLQIDLASRELVLVGGDLAIVRGVEAVRQDLDMRLQVFAGEWFLDETVGIPYFERVLVKSPNVAQIRSVFREEIRRSPQVSGVTRLDLDLDRRSRTLRVGWAVTTAAGNIQGATSAPIA